MREKFQYYSLLKHLAPHEMTDSTLSKLKSRMSDGHESSSHGDGRQENNNVLHCFSNLKFQLYEPLFP